MNPERDGRAVGVPVVHVERLDDSPAESLGVPVPIAARHDAHVTAARRRPDRDVDVGMAQVEQSDDEVAQPTPVWVAPPVPPLLSTGCCGTKTSVPREKPRSCRASMISTSISTWSERMSSWSTASRMTSKSSRLARTRSDLVNWSGTIVTGPSSAEAATTAHASARLLRRSYTYRGPRPTGRPLVQGPCGSRAALRSQLPQGVET